MKLIINKTVYFVINTEVVLPYLFFILRNGGLFRSISFLVFSPRLYCRLLADTQRTGGSSSLEDMKSCS